MMHKKIHISSTKQAFTLLEIITAVTIYSVLILAVSALLQNAIRLRNQAQSMAETRQVRIQAKSIIQRDLLNIVAPNGSLSGWLISQNEVLSGERRDQLEFFTSSGIISNGAYQSDVQKVVYTLIPNENNLTENALSLTRYIYRYVLSESDDNPMQIVLLDSVISMAFEFYDGNSWYSEWNSEEQDPPMPEAIRVQLAYMSNPEKEEIQTVDLLLPIRALKYEDEEEDSDTEESSSNDDLNRGTQQQVAPPNTGGRGQGGRQGGQGGQGGRQPGNGGGGR